MALAQSIVDPILTLVRVELLLQQAVLHIKKKAQKLYLINLVHYPQMLKMT